MGRWPADVDARVQQSFDPPLSDRIPIEEQIARQQHAEAVKTRTSILFMLVGGILVTGASAAMWGIWAGVGALGVLVFILGVLFGLAS